jgi:competence protein ComEC
MAVAGSRSIGWWSVVALLPAVLTRRNWIVALALAGLISGLASTARAGGTRYADIPTGGVTLAARLADDLRPSGFELRAPIQPTHLLTRAGWEPWAGPRLVLVAEAGGDAAAGEAVVVTGRLRAWDGWIRGDPVAGALEASSLEPLGPSSDPLFRTGNAIRGRVQAVLRDRGPAGALLSGFLIGEVGDLPTVDQENLRLAGLSHFVAVSGSNVALFLAALFVAAGPLGWSPGRRAVVGLLGLAVFVVVTRWEPSVVRASFMAALVLLGRVAGIALTAWAALGWAVVFSLLVGPELVDEVGFQLSVAATGGVLVGGRWARSGDRSVVAQSLGVTLGAQAAVAPLLLWHFGSVPMLAPLTNLVAAPIVTLATALAGVAVVTGVPAAVTASSLLAGGILQLAELAAAWPQLGLAGTIGVAGVLGVAWHSRRLRPALALVVSVIVASGLLPAGRVTVPTAVFLDVGQGDATLLLGGSGETILVDGGPDARVLLAKLRRRGIDHLDLVVATHGDLDHIGGLGAAVETYPVGRLWHPGHSEGSGLYSGLLETADRRGVLLETPSPGWSASIGSFSIEVFGPHRRYADINDESIVLRVGAGSTQMLLTGDIEHTAQRDLGPVAVDVLKVPHHGAATTDPDWLAAAAPATAVISVGQNDFGHPAPEILQVLHDAGSLIRRTDHEGDIVIPFAP